MVLVAVMAGAAVAGLGGTAAFGTLGGPGGPARQRLTAAILSTAAAGTADVTMQLHLGVAGQSVALVYAGTVDLASETAALRMEKPALPLRIVVTRHDEYLELGKLVSGRFPGKPWVELPTSARHAGRAPGPGATPSPTAPLNALLDAGASVTRSRTRLIHGVDDAGYRVRVTSRELRAHPRRLARAFGAFTGTPGTAGRVTAMTATYYVSPAGQLQSEVVVLRGSAAGSPTALSFDVTLSRIGTAPSPVVPPRSKTVTYRRYRARVGALPGLPLSGLSQGLEVL